MYHLEDRRDQAERGSRTAHARIQAERRLAAYRTTSNDVQEIYTRQWSTEAQRLTALITEVKSLAVASELVPKSDQLHPRGAVAAEGRAHQRGDRHDQLLRAGQLSAGAEADQPARALAAVHHHRSDRPRHGAGTEPDAQPATQDSLPRHDAGRRRPRGALEQPAAKEDVVLSARCALPAARWVL